MILTLIRVLQDEDFIPELRRPNGSVSLIFLDSSEILYTNKTEDPWFSATTERPSNHSAVVGADFVPDEPVGVLGCSTERLYCNPKLPQSVGCIDSLNIDPSNLSSSLKRAWPDENHESIMRAFLSTLAYRSMEIFYDLPNSPSLLSRNTIVMGLQTATIPKNRWQEEREYLYKTNLAFVQYSIVDHARGYTRGSDDYCLEKPSCRKICYSQVCA